MTQLMAAIFLCLSGFWIIQKSPESHKQNNFYKILDFIFGFIPAFAGYMMIVLYFLAIL